MLNSRRKKRLGRPPSGSAVNGKIKGVGAETQQLILDTAISVFAEQGFDSVSMRQIATLADITPASIYNYYKDKRSLYLAACKHSLGEAAQRILQAVDKGTSPRDRLFRFVRALTMVDPRATRLFMRELVEADREGLALLENDSFEGAFRTLIELLRQATGEPPSPARAASVFALVLGLKQISKFLEIGGGTDLRLHQDYDVLTEHVLQLVAPPS
jgi:AcrR family transcriptional regulator